MSEEKSLQQIIEELDNLPSLIEKRDAAEQDLKAAEEACEADMQDSLVGETGASLREFEKESRKAMDEKYPKGCPIKVEEIPFPEFATPAKERRAIALFRFSLVLGAAIFVAGIIFSKIFWGAVMALVLVGVAYWYRQHVDHGYLGKCRRWISDLAVWQRKISSFDAEAEKAFLSNCLEYDQMYGKHVAACEEKLKESLPALIKDRQASETTALAQIEQKKQTRDQAQAALDAVTVLAPDQYSMATQISEMLKAGRVETVESAIEAILEEARKEGKKGKTSKKATKSKPQEKAEDGAEFSLRDKREALKWVAYPRPAKWFRDYDGKENYKKLKTKQEKILFYYSYLCSLRLGNHNDNTNRHKTPHRSLCETVETKKTFETVYHIACIMALAVDGSSLHYASYPDILDRNKNPLVRLVDDYSFDMHDENRENKWYAKDGTVCEKFAMRCKEIFCQIAYRDSEDVERGEQDYMNCRLTPVDGDLDQYRLEQYYIWFVLAKNGVPLPYDYTLQNAMKKIVTTKRKEDRDE